MLAWLKLRLPASDQICLPKGSLIGFLGGCKPTPVDAVVDGWIHPTVHFLNGRLEIFWVQIQVRVFGNVVELTASNTTSVMSATGAAGACTLLTQAFDSLRLFAPPPPSLCARAITTSAIRPSALPPVSPLDYPVTLPLATLV